jgi:plastocyanin
VQTTWRQARLAGVAVAAAAMLACSSGSNGGGGTGPNGGHSNVIVASSSTTGGAYGMGGNYFFSPTPDTVAAGTAVDFRFGSVVHNVHFDAVANAPDSIASTSNANVARTFTKAGMFNYHCLIHGIGGTVIVQ